MAPRSIVERFDVLRDVSLCDLSVPVDSLLDALLLQAAEERFRNGIVPAVASTAHARLQVIGSTEAPPVITAVLTTLVRVNDRAPGSTTTPGHQHGIQHNFAIERRPR